MSKQKPEIDKELELELKSRGWLDKYGITIFETEIWNSALEKVIEEIDKRQNKWSPLLGTSSITEREREKVIRTLRELEFLKHKLEKLKRGGE